MGAHAEACAGETAQAVGRHEVFFVSDLKVRPPKKQRRYCQAIYWASTHRWGWLEGPHFVRGWRATEQIGCKRGTDSAEFGVGNGLPAEAVGLGREVGKTSEIEDDLVVAEPRAHTGILTIGIADYDEIGIANDFLQRGAEQGSDVRDFGFGELFVGSVETAPGNVWIVDLNFAAFTEKALHDVKERAFAQIVSTFFEAEAKATDFSFAGHQDSLDSLFDMRLIAGHDGVQ
jgi:hypothetical protein